MSIAIAYLRVSTGLQAEKGMGLEVQRQAVLEHAAAHGLELVDVVQEAASGGIRAGEVSSWEHRPALLELIERAKSGEYDTLLVAKFDRLSRDAPSLEMLVRMLGTGKHPVAVVSAAEENGDGAVARLMRHTLAGFAEFERSLIRERLQAGKQQRKNQGRHIHGRIPYGYRTAGRGELEPDENTADVVRRIFVAAREGKSLNAIARSLTADGIPSPQGARRGSGSRGWEAKTVSRILSNTVYAGERHRVKNAHPAIVTRRTFNAAQVERTKRSRVK